MLRPILLFALVLNLPAAPIRARTSTPLLFMKSRSGIRNGKLIRDWEPWRSVHVFSESPSGEPIDPTAKETQNLQRKRKDEFILNKGKLVDSIRSSPASIFIGDQDLSCMRDDVSLHIMVARLGLNTRLTGKRKYKAWFNGLRWTANAIFDYSEVNPIIILKETERTSPLVR